MALISEKTRIRIQWIVIRGQSVPLFRWMSRLWCRLGGRRVSRLLLKIPGVEAVYSRHTHPGASSFVPGHSDLDVTIVLSEQASADPRMIETVSKRVDKLSWFHFYLSPDDVRFTTRKELNRAARDRYTRYEPLYTPDDWLLLAGEEIREGKAEEFSAGLIPWHPEFNRWWQHVLQDYLLGKKPGLEDRYLRVFYRSALRQQLNFLAASGKEVKKSGGHVDDDMVQAAFSHDPEVLDLLLGIKRSGFWHRDPRGIKERILLAAFRSAADFFRTFASYPGAGRDGASPGKDLEAHRAAYDRLGSFIDRLHGFKSMLKGILVYPVPHWLPYFYNVELIIPDDMSPEQFRETVRASEESFKGREFYLDGRGYMITYIPESVINSPLFFLGSPYPFFKENVGRYGMWLLGGEPPALEGEWDTADLATWCRVFLPYHRMTLARRVEHSSRTVNFCQLGSVRLFLETGEKVTDAKILMSRYKEVFQDGNPDAHVWKYVLSDKPGRTNGENYRSATHFVLREYGLVQEMLEKCAFEIPGRKPGH